MISAIITFYTIAMAAIIFGLGNTAAVAANILWFFFTIGAFSTLIVVALATGVMREPRL